MTANPLKNSYAKAYEKLALMGQVHLLNFWGELSAHQQQNLLQQIDMIKSDLYCAQLNLLKTQIVHQEVFTPYLDYSTAGSQENQLYGQQLISEGKVGCLVVAGGQGTRLHFKGPKGIFPVTPVRHKSLFQLFAEKTVAASKLAAIPLRMAIMTSPQNDEETKAFFIQNKRFGLEPQQLSFFSQEVLPLLDSAGNMFLTEPGCIAAGPDGNGSCLSHFVKSGVWQSWQKQGIEYLNLILVDNALADPFDAELVGFHAAEGSQVTVKCIERLSVEEKVGLLVDSPKGVHVIEYSEMPASERVARLEDGALKHRCANISTFCFNSTFVEETATQAFLSLHLAHKAVPYINDHGDKIVPKMPNAWKFERFIFDVIPLAKSVSALMYSREVCFAPLKNKSGENSLKTVQTALMHREKKMLELITGKKVDAKEIELAPQFYYPTSELLKRWRNRSVINIDYIEDI